MCGLICDLKKAELGAVIGSPPALRLCRGESLPKETRCLSVCFHAERAVLETLCFGADFSQGLALPALATDINFIPKDEVAGTLPAFLCS